MVDLPIQNQNVTQSAVEAAASSSGISRETGMTLMILFISQAIIGIIGIEYAWSRTKRFREIDEERDGKFPAFRRVDAKNWSRWKFYPGAMFLMPARLILLAIDGIFLTHVVK